MTIIPESALIDQRIMRLLIEHNDTVQRYRAFFVLLEWSVVPDPPIDPFQPGKRAHPQSAYKINEGFPLCTQLRRFLVEHPLLVLDQCFLSRSRYLSPTCSNL